jgi:hypothetical protein
MRKVVPLEPIYHPGIFHNAGWATAWHPSPAGQPAYAACCNARAPARSLRADHARDGALTGGSVVARRRQGVARDLEGVTGKVSGKEERAGAHRNGGSTVRRRKRPRVAVFISGRGLRWMSTVGVGSCSTGEARGVRKLQVIAGIGSSGGAHRGVVDGGGARP